MMEEGWDRTWGGEPLDLSCPTPLPVLVAPLSPLVSLDSIFLVGWAMILEAQPLLSTLEGHGCLLCTGHRP